MVKVKKKEKIYQDLIEKKKKNMSIYELIAPYLNHFVFFSTRMQLKDWSSVVVKTKLM